MKYLLAITMLLSMAAAQNCPVSLNLSWTTLQTVDGYNATGYTYDLNVGMKIERTNMADKEIVAERYATMYINEFNESSELISLKPFDDHIKVGKKHKTTIFYPVASYGKKITATVWLDKAAFADGSVWQDDGKHICAATK